MILYPCSNILYAKSVSSGSELFLILYFFSYSFGVKYFTTQYDGLGQENS